MKTLLACLLLLAAPATATTVAVSGRQLQVNCAPFIIRGMNYSPAAIGQGTGGFDWYSNSALLAQDVAAMKAMGVNTVRVYLDYAAVWNNSGGDPNNDPSTNPSVVANVNAALNTFQANGIYVILNYWLPYNEALLSNPIPRQWEKLKFQKLMRVFKSHPAVLMWVLGNENNAAWNRSITAPQLFSFIQEAVSAAKAAEAPPQPIAVVLVQTASDGVTQDHMNPALLNAAPAVDLWGLNLYQSAGGFVAALDGYTDPRPLFLAEYGQDAWNKTTGALDTASQASYFQARWANAIGPRLSALNASNKLAGACAFEWNDEWYKDPAGTWGAHDYGGNALNNDNDNFANEEWFGFAPALATGANGPRAYRPAYATLQALWTAAPYNSVPPASCCPSCAATATPTATPTPDPCAPAMFDDFESLTLANTWGGAWGASQQDNACYATAGLSGYSGGGLNYGFNTVGNWSVLYSSLGPVADPAGNSGAGSGAVDLSPWGQVRFWAKTSAPGTYYFCVASTLALSPGYSWYRAPFTLGSGWTEVVLSLDVATFGNPGGNYGSWAQNEASATQFTVVPPANASGTLNLDNVRLTKWCGVPTATTTPTPFGTATPTPNACLPLTIDDFENGTAVNSWGGVWNQAQQVGNGAVTVAAGSQSGQGLRWDYNATAGWVVLFTGLNPGADPAGNGGAGLGLRDLRAYGKLTFWVKASAAGAYYFKVASTTNDSNSYNWYQAPFNATTAWTQVTFDLGGSAFVNPGNNSATWAGTLSRATQFAITTQGSSSGTLQIDGLVMQAWCGMPSPTFTASASASASPSRTASSTPGAQPSQTATATASPSATPTSTRTTMPSLSSTPTPSPTVSLTAKSSPSPTQTPSASPTASPSATATPSPTPSKTRSPSPSATLTPTPSPTASASASDTPTWTPVPAGSTLTATPTSSPSPSATATRTPSPSASATATASATLTSTGTPTPSPSPSGSPSASPSLTASATASPTWTATPTWTLTPLATPTPSATPSATPSPTLAAPTATVLGQGPCRIGSVVPLPNPDPKWLAILMDGPADAVKLRVFSKAMTLVRVGEIQAQLSLGWNHVPLAPDLLAGLPSGLYFLSTSPSRAGVTGFAGPTAKLVLLR